MYPRLGNPGTATEYGLVVGKFVCLIRQIRMAEFLKSSTEMCMKVDRQISVYDV